MKCTDNELLNQLHKAVKGERNATLYVLNLLRETNDRQLHLKLGYGSLLEFCVKELKYSETSANRRISAMYAMLSVPVIEEKIQSGTLSLDVIAKAQSHIRQKEKIASVQVDRKVQINREERASLFESLSGMSCREAEKELIKQDPEVFDIKNKKDSLRQITPELQELKIILDQEMQVDIEKLILLLSHVMPGATIKEVLKFALKESIKKRNLQRPVKESIKKREMQTSVKESIKIGNPPVPVIERHAQPAPVKVEIKRPAVRVPISTAFKRAVWKKSQGQCCYRHNGRRCSSRFQLQIDHIVAVAKGGSNDIDNLHLLCRQHNQFKGVGSDFGSSNRFT